MKKAKTAAETAETMETTEKPYNETHGFLLFVCNGLIQLRAGTPHRSLHRLVLDEGRACPAFLDPCEYRLTATTPRACYANCLMEVVNQYGLTYVEGYAVHRKALPVPIEHAWTVTREGYVVDPTWGHQGRNYWGIPFRRDWLVRTAMRTKYSGVLVDMVTVRALVTSPAVRARAIDKGMQENMRRLMEQMPPEKVAG